MLKIDLHTHSIASPDGGLRASQYASLLDRGILDYVAITDHNQVDEALKIQKTLGSRIIVGAEIMSQDGEIIGLFLKKNIPPGRSAAETVELIKDQGGIVYIPHPFETVRKGLSTVALEIIQDKIDILEVYNGRAFFQNRSQQAVLWAKANSVPVAASSDAHGIRGIGKTYTVIAQPPTPDNIVELYASGTPIARRASLTSLLYPKYFTISKKLPIRGRRG